MTIATYVDPEGWQLRVFSSMYLDWGLEILDPNGVEVFYSPSCLSAESYGFKAAEHFDSWEDANASDDPDAFEAWSEEDWLECLKSEAWELLDCYAPRDVEANPDE